MQDKIFLSLLYRMNDPYHVYVDLDVINNDYNATRKSYLRFEETRNTPILPGDSADYFCSVVRFNVQTGNTLPVFIPKIQTGNNRNKTVYSLTLNLMHFASVMTQSYSATVNVMYTQEDFTAPLPARPTKGQDISSTYYYVYTYQHFVKLVNNAFRSAWDELKQLWKSSAPGDEERTDADWAVMMGGDVQTYNAEHSLILPFIEFDVSSCMFQLHLPYRLFVFDTHHYNGSNNAHLELIMNPRLYELFAGIPAQYASFSGVLGYQIRVDHHLHGHKYNISLANPAYAAFLLQNPNYNPNNPPQNDTAPPKKLTLEMISIIQEMSSIALWNPVASIVFASSLLPIIPTQTSVPRDIGGENNHLVSSGNNSNLLPILSDFSIAVGPNNQYRPCVEYAPGAEYRLLDMNSTANLNRVDIIVYWKDRSGGMHPLELQPGCAASVKLMFRRKDFDVGL